MFDDVEAKKDIFEINEAPPDADGCEENKTYSNTTGIIFY